MQNRITARFWFCRRPGGLKINIRCTFVYFGSHTFVSISWMCKTQTSVSHSSTEAELISLDASLRMDGLPALDLWDWWKKSFTLLQPNQRKPKIKHEETRRVTQHQTSTLWTKPRFQLITPILNWVTLIMFRRTRSLLNSVRFHESFAFSLKWGKLQKKTSCWAESNERFARQYRCEPPRKCALTRHSSPFFGSKHSPPHERKPRNPT